MTRRLFLDSYICSLLIRSDPIRSDPIRQYLGIDYYECQQGAGKKYYQLQQSQHMDSLTRLSVGQARGYEAQRFYPNIRLKKLMIRTYHHYAAKYFVLKVGVVPSR